MKPQDRLKWVNLITDADDADFAPLIVAGLVAARPMPKGQAEFRLTFAGWRKFFPQALP